jgi:transmembrane sensor
MLRREAANWLARLHSGRDPQIEAKIRPWQDADPRNAAAFERVRRSYEQAGLLRHSPAASPLPRSSPDEAPRRAPAYALAAAAALVFLIPAGLLLLRSSGSPFAATDVLMLATSVGEIRQVTLGDGSKVTLDTNTRLNVEIGPSRRRARLTQGRARFRVAPASAPFIIETKAATVSSDGGAMDVDRSEEQSVVNVLAGSAEVRGAGRSSFKLRLGPGDGASAAAGKLTPRREPGLAVDWTRGMLQFDGTPLPVAVAEANRYSERKIVLGNGLDQFRVTGAFRTGDAVGLAKALAAAFHLTLKPDSAGDLVLSAKHRE